MALSVQTLNKQSDNIGLSCPYDHDTFKVGDRVVICPGTCKSAHHVDCWQENGNKCATFGCNGQGVISETAGQPEPVWEPTIYTSTTPATPTGSTLPSFSLPSLSPRLGGWLALISVLLLNFYIPPRQSAILASVVVLTLIVLLAERSQSNTALRPAPHVNFLSALAFGALGLEIAVNALPTIIDFIPQVENYSYWVWVAIIGLFTFIGGWSSSRRLSPDNAGLVRAIAGLALVYMLILWMEDQGYEPLVTALAAAGASVGLMISGFWANGLVLDPIRIGKSALGALTLTLAMIGLGYALFDLGWMSYVEFAEPVLSLPLFWRVLIALAAVFGANESGSDFAVSLLKWLAWLILVGIVVVGAYFGYVYALENLANHNLAYIGALVGGLIGLIVARVVYRVGKGLFE